MSKAETQYKLDEGYAVDLDKNDALAKFRSQFVIPETETGEKKIYFCGNSLGLSPVSVPETMMRELTRWQKLGIDGFFTGTTPWATYQNPLREKLSGVIGSLPVETVVMNTLTINLHILLFSFYQPTQKRYKILMGSPSFPSDRYAMTSHLKVKGMDPDEALIIWAPRPREHALNMNELESILQKQGDEIALIWLEGVNYLTGQVLDISQITKLGHDYGCIVGFDLAHAVGNISLKLHDWQLDFAVWCSYKYLNGGPGAVGGCFVHEKHVNKPISQLAGWWGNDLRTRFKFEEKFIPYPGTDRWQISTPLILSMLPLEDSLRLFEQATFPLLRKKSQLLTGYLRFLIESQEMSSIKIITPSVLNMHGCQLSLAIMQGANEVAEELSAKGVICDFRAPNIIRLAPVPLYNTFHEVWRVSEILKKQFAGQ